VPSVCCQPPDRTELLSVTICRAEARISAQVSSIVGVRPIPRVNHCDPMISRSGNIDRGVSWSRRGNELEIGKALDDVARQRGTLAHDTYDIKGQQSLNQRVGIGEMVLKYRDVHSIAKHRPIGAFQRHVLVVVENSNVVLLHRYPFRGDRFGPLRRAAALTALFVRLNALFTLAVAAPVLTHR
jgi:hypothetical protein